MSLPSIEEIDLLHSHCCQAISDPKRILIIYALEKNALNVSELADSLGLPQSTVSRHLKQLLDRGLIHSHREGPAVIYALSDQRVIKALDIMREVLADNLRRQAQLVKIVS